MSFSFSSVAGTIHANDEMQRCVRSLFGSSFHFGSRRFDILFRLSRFLGLIVNSTLTSHAFTRANSSRACGSSFFKLTLQCSLCAFSLKDSSPRTHAMFRTLIDPPLTSPSQSTPTSSSLLFPSHWLTTSTPQTGLLFGRFAEQSPLAGHEPNAPVEVSSTEATPIMLPSRKGSLGSTYNSGDDLATSPAASEVGERSDPGMLGSLGTYHTSLSHLCSGTAKTHSEMSK